MNLRVLVVDDTVLYRTVVSQAFEEIPGVEVVGKAGNGKTALMRIRSLNPDLVTLDVEMPEMNGLEVLEVIRREGLECGVIMISSLTREGGEATLRALELGAFDFITKPDGNDSMAQSGAKLREDLKPLVEGFRKRKAAADKAGNSVAPPSTRAEASPVSPSVKVKPVPSGGTDFQQVISRMGQLAGRQKPRCIAIGVSTGGPVALARVIPRLPGNLGIPVFIVQHMPPLFTASLARSLGAKSLLTVKEAEDGETAQPNTVYIAPGGYQMKVVAGPSGQLAIRITNDPPENNCKPAVDYLFRSLAHLIPGQVTGVIMTGMGRDGTLGGQLLKRHGGLMIAQDEETSTVYGMPMEAAKAGVPDLILPLDDIAGAIEKSVRF